MQIQSGKLYENKTWEYLYPTLKYYGEELSSKLAMFFKLAVGVRDLNRREEHNCLYILIDTDMHFSDNKKRERYKSNFTSFLNWLSYKDYFVTDYIYENINSGKHMIVLKIPKKFDKSYMSFIQGKYSEMYSIRDTKKYFKYLVSANKTLEKRVNLKIEKVRQVLSKNKKYLPVFLKIVNDKFKTNVGEKYFKDAELDFPPDKKEEFFNYG